VHHYAAVCLDLRTERRSSMDRCELVGQDAYRRWYVAEGTRIPAIGESPRGGSTAAPNGHNVRIAEDLLPEGGVFDPPK
jgi:hypothetical protein